MPTRFTISHAGGSSTQEFSGAPEQVYFNDLLSGTEYSVTAELYYGDTVIDTDTKTFKTSIEYITDVFYLQNETDAENVLTLTKNGTPRTTDLEYSLDEGSNWTAFDLTQSTNTVTIPADGRLYMRSSTGFSKNSSSYLNINCSNSFSVQGNLQCLHNYKDLSDLSVDTYEFFKLFSYTSTLISAKYMYLPATTLAEGCYYSMFLRCRSLKDAPELPATTLATTCYFQMFDSCSSLTEAPELPATTIAGSCYKYMFEYCTALTTAPKLPATTIAGNCYYAMFRGCTSLTTAPELPATTLMPECYYYMFWDCTSLTVAPVLPATTLVYYCYLSMFAGCTNLQSVTTYVTNWDTSRAGGWLSGAGTNATNPTVYCPADSTIPSDSVSGIPEGWTRADLVTN